MTDPVSVVLAAKDAGQTLERAVESILAQDYRDFELVLVNDGSRDETPDIMDAFASASDGVRVLHLRQNVGRAAARNLAIAAARFRLVAIMDADDYSLPDRLARLVPRLDDQTAVVGGQVLAFDENGIRRFGTWPVSAEETRRFLRAGRSPVAHSTCILRRQDFELVGGYRPELSYAEDFDLMSRIVQLRDIVNVEDVVGLYYRPLRDSYRYLYRNHRRVQTGPDGRALLRAAKVWLRQRVHSVQPLSSEEVHALTRGLLHSPERIPPGRREY
jgi:glycosyltransferase involved in cell wall biosynthesis